MLLASTVTTGYGLTTQVAGAEIPEQYQEGYEILNCLDISKYQKEISASDWKTIKKSGVSAVIIRAGYSSYDTEEHKPDVHFEENIKRASDAGLEVGVYYFSAAVNKEEARSEAEYFVDMIEEYRDRITLPVVMDFETNQRGRFTAQVMNALGVEGCTEMCEAFLDVVKDAGYDPMLYASRSVLDNDLDHEKLEKKYKIWLAQYPRNGSAPTYEGEYYMWQYSSNVRLEGIDARVDANYLFREDAGAKAEVIPISLYADSDEDADSSGKSGKSGKSDTGKNDGKSAAGKSDGEKADASDSNTDESTVSFRISDGVSSQVPVTSDGDSSSVTVTDKSGNVHEYQLYKVQSEDSNAAKTSRSIQTETTLASLLSGYFTAKHEIDPEYVAGAVLPAVLQDYEEQLADGKQLSMQGICQALTKLKLKAAYRQTIGDDVYTEIKSHLAQGKPVLLWTHTNNERWGNNASQVMLLVGMDETGYAILVDPLDREWSESDQRVKLVSVTELVEYMKAGPDSEASYTSGNDGGYILVDK